MWSLCCINLVNVKITTYDSFLSPKEYSDLFAPKFYSLIQNNIDPNFGDGLNFVKCENSFNRPKKVPKQE